MKYIFEFLSDLFGCLFILVLVLLPLSALLLAITGIIYFVTAIF